MEKSQNILHEDEKFIYDMMDDVLNNAKQKIKTNIQNYNLNFASCVASCLPRKYRFMQFGRE